MKIGIDARICDEAGYYEQYVWELIIAFCQENSQHEITVYRGREVPLEIKNTVFTVCKIDRLKSSKA